MKLTTDRYEASRGLFATAELLVRQQTNRVALIKSLLYCKNYFQCDILSKSHNFLTYFSCAYSSAPAEQ